MCAWQVDGNDFTPMKETKTSIVIVICYFGQFPWYFEFFLKSVEFNPSVRFLLFTDQETEYPIPANMELVNMTLKELESLASVRTNCKVNLSNSYKICDIKPAYGDIFKDYLADYDFWGHGDLDLIFGNIRSLISEEALSHFDIVNARPEYITGFFCLYRNIETINLLYRCSKDYRRVFEGYKYYCFDECSFAQERLWDGESIFDQDCEIESMTHIIKRLSNENVIKADFSLKAVEGTPGNVCWEEGVLIYKEEYEGLLYHFINFKKNPLSHFPKWRKIPNTYYIEQNYFSKFSPDSLIGKVIKVRQTVRFKLRKKINSWKLGLDYLISRFSKTPQYFQDEVFSGEYIYEYGTPVILSKSQDQIFLSYKNSSFKTNLIHINNNKFVDFKSKTTYYLKHKPGLEIELVVAPLNRNSVAYRKYL